MLIYCVLLFIDFKLLFIVNIEPFLYICEIITFLSDLFAFNQFRLKIILIDNIEFGERGNREITGL